MPKAARLDRIPCQVISFDLVHDLPILRFNTYRSLSDAVELHEFAFVSGADISVIEHVSERKRELYHRIYLASFASRLR